MDQSTKIYNFLPNIGDIVSIVIKDNKNPDYFPVNLPDFGIDGIIPYSSITKKKKIRNINKIAPVNKILPAFVESIDDVVVLSRLYIDVNSEEYKFWDEGKQASKKINSMVSYLIRNEISKEYIDENILNILLEEWDKEKNFFDFIKNNHEKLDLNENARYHLNKFMEKTNLVKKEIYNTKFMIVANDGIDNMINCIKPLVVKYNNLKITVENYPTFVINSTSDNSSIKDHEMFLEELNSIEDKKFLINLSV